MNILIDVVNFVSWIYLAVVVVAVGLTASYPVLRAIDALDDENLLCAVVVSFVCFVSFTIHHAVRHPMQVFRIYGLALVVTYVSLGIWTWASEDYLSLQIVVFTTLLYALVYPLTRYSIKYELIRELFRLQRQSVCS